MMTHPTTASPSGATATRGFTTTTTTTPHHRPASRIINQIHGRHFLLNLQSLHHQPPPPQPKRALQMASSATGGSGRDDGRRGAASSSISTTTTTSQEPFLIPWPVPLVTCHGDYRQETWLEQYIGGPLYEHQDKLARLPVPTVEETLTRFLPTALPLAQSPAEIQALQQAVQAFPAQAAELQQRLIRRQQVDYADSSWLQHWWNTWGYLEVRDPVVIHVSYFFQFAPDPTARGAIPRAAALLTAVAEHRRKVASGQAPAERVGKPRPDGTGADPLCSTAYKYMYHATRIPGSPQDEVHLHDPARHHHAIVARKGHFFALDFIDPQTQQPRPLSVLEQGLAECCRQADQLVAQYGTQGKLGWLTSMNRDDWAQARQTLLAEGQEAMQQALQVLESGAVLLCLDDVRPVTKAQVSQVLWHGTVQHGYNRWFDKSVQLIVTDNGQAGFLGEHALMDGMPCTRLADWCVQRTHGTIRREQEAAALASSSAAAVRPIFAPVWAQSSSSIATSFPRTETWIAQAKSDFTKLVEAHALHVESFHGYGSDFIKQSGFSPDAYVQVAMQLATYRLWGEQAGTYEATQVRPFLHGRTETTRSVSLESAAFVQRMGLYPAMDEHDADVRKEKLSLLQQAVQAHVKYLGNAAKGKGVDRHFLGLSMLVEPGEATPDLYSDPVFIRAKRWRVSTSHLTHPKFDNWGYGEVVPDGVGLAYSIHPRHCVFNVTALKEHGWTDKLCHLLEEALLEMRTVVEMSKGPPTVSKL